MTEDPRIESEADLSGSRELSEFANTSASTRTKYEESLYSTQFKIESFNSQNS